MPSQPALPAMTQPPRDTSVADAARRAARDARLAREREQRLIAAIRGQLHKHGPLTAAELYAWLDVCYLTLREFKRLLADLEREGKVIHGPQGWGVK